MPKNNYENIPAELKAVKQWVCWNSDKLPKNPKTGGNAQSNNKSTWGTFDEDVAAVDKQERERRAYYMPRQTASWSKTARQR